MPLSPPTAEAQVAFLRDVQRLLAEGSFTATYKFALLQALADLAVLRGDDDGDALPDVADLVDGQAAPRVAGGIGAEVGHRVAQLSCFSAGDDRHHAG